MPALNRLTNTELLSFVHAGFNALTTTDLEREVAERLQAFVDAENDLAPLLKDLEDKDLEPADLVALLDEFSCTDLKTLREKLERADKWYAIAEEAGDLFQRLQDLTKTTL